MMHGFTRRGVDWLDVKFCLVLVAAILAEQQPRERVKQRRFTCAVVAGNDGVHSVKRHFKVANALEIDEVQ